MTRYGPYCPEVVTTPVMIHQWRWLTFLHWAYDPAVVQPLLPDGYRVEPYDGRAWVGLVPFEMRLRAPGVPVWWTFPETNLRTYVTGPDGRTGIWFLSLDAGDLSPVLAARSVYRLPYCWARMGLARYERTVRYESSRRWPGPTGARCDLTVEVGEPYGELTEFDHYLTARFALYSEGPAVRSRTAVVHEPWPLRRATVTSLDQTVVEAAGLPSPEGPPLVHWSAGVTIRVGPPHPVREAARAG